MAENVVPLYVRLSEEPNRRLERAVSISGKSKRQIVEEAVSEHLTDEGVVVVRGEGVAVGRADSGQEPPQPSPEPDQVLTLQEAADLLKIDSGALKAAASAGRVPTRRIGGKWRFSRAALLAWLDNSE